MREKSVLDQTGGFFGCFLLVVGLSLFSEWSGVSSLKASNSDNGRVNGEGELVAWMGEFCFSCHGENKAKGGLNLGQLLKERPLIKNKERWEHVVDLIRSREMPPEGELQPSSKDRQQAIEVVRKALDDFDYSSVRNPGFEPARRLTHREYNHTLRDLLRVPINLAIRFPGEMSGASGFDNSANTLFFQTALMERYISAAERAVELLFTDKNFSNREGAAFRTLVLVEPSAHMGVEKAAEKVIGRFLYRAYRRPPTEHEREDAMQRFKGSYGSGNDFVEAVKETIQAVLVSPSFLLRLERGGSTSSVYRVNPFELASRLSYFLWASMPDDELLALAGNGLLADMDVVHQQVRRMLLDDRASTLGTAFASQWLGFQFIGHRIRLDPIDNPWCTDSLMTAMRAESSLFFTSLVRENRPIDDLIDGDYSFLNEELASVLYDNDEVQGEAMRRVSLSNNRRRGILSHASVLAVTSNYKETSPIKRGNWLLETILGKPLPPPPPNAGAFSEEVEEDDSLTFREKVELHSSSPSCRSCHRKIDPLGFSLENFDYFGRWREAYRVRIEPRRDEEALELVSLMRAIPLEEIEERLRELDAGAVERNVIRERLLDMRTHKELTLEKHIRSELSAIEVNRLVRWMDRLGIEVEDDYAGLQAMISSLRDLSYARLQEKLAALEVSESEREAIRAELLMLRAVPDEELEFFVEEELDGEVSEWVEEILMEMNIMDLKEPIPRKRRPEPEFVYKPITGEATLPDGTGFSGPAGLRRVLLEKHRDDIGRQIASKMLAYALGRQLEYYDEPALNEIMNKVRTDDYRLGTLVASIVDSYPFRYKMEQANASN